MKAPKLPNKFSTLSVREQTQARIEYQKQIIEWYSQPEFQGENEREINQARLMIDRYQQLADHYDEEVNAGYKHPTTRRNNKPF